jgi:hypothetical protein
MSMNLRSLLPSFALLLVTAAACSDQSGVTPDAAVAQDSGTPSDTLPTPDMTTSADVPRLDAPAADAPRADVPASDVPASDVPASDVPASDVSASDVSASDVSASDVSASDVPANDVPRADAGTDVPPPSDACTRPAIEQLSTRIDCRMGGDGACPTGYACLSESGFVLQRFCGRACRTDCDCATGDVCGSYTDKAGTHPICLAASRDRR